MTSNWKRWPVLVYARISVRNIGLTAEAAIPLFHIQVKVISVSFIGLGSKDRAKKCCRRRGREAGVDTL